MLSCRGYDFTVDLLCQQFDPRASPLPPQAITVYNKAIWQSLSAEDAQVVTRLLHRVKYSTRSVSERQPLQTDVVLCCLASRCDKRRALSMWSEVTTVFLIIQHLSPLIDYNICSFETSQRESDLFPEICSFFLLLTKRQHKDPFSMTANSARGSCKAVWAQRRSS